MKRLYHYFPKTFIMNPEEYRFFKVFKELLGVNYIIIPQVHLDDLVKPMSGRSRIFSFRHINQKSVDFVICNPTSMSPKTAIEIDGISHSNERTKDRDEEVERILREAGLPLIRFKNGDHTDKDLISKKLTETLQKP